MPLILLGEWIAPINEAGPGLLIITVPLALIYSVVILLYSLINWRMGLLSVLYLIGIIGDVLIFRYWVNLPT